MKSGAEPSVKDQSCCDCGGFDIEWMYRCHKHGTEYCRGCECSVCADEAYDDDGDGCEDDQEGGYG